jgi:hypothetical protein
MAPRRIDGSSRACLPTAAMVTMLEMKPPQNPAIANPT